jgi:hypothetical protein
MHYFSAFLPYYGPYFRSSRAFQGPVPYEIPFNPYSSRIDPPTATLRTDRNTAWTRSRLSFSVVSSISVFVSVIPELLYRLLFIYLFILSSLPSAPSLPAMADTGSWAFTPF